METSEKVIQQIKRVITKIVGKYPAGGEILPATDIILQVNQETGDLLAFNDNDEELTRCVIDEWIGNTDENFYEEIGKVIGKCLNEMRPTLLSIGIMKPFTFTLADEERETFSELYIVDNDTFMLGNDIMESLDKELDDFFNNLMKD